MSIYQLRTFGDIVSAIREEIQIQSTDTTALNRIKRDINIIYQEVVGKKNWWWLNGNITVQLPVYASNGTATVNTGSSLVTLTVAPLGVSRKGYKFAIDGYSEIYTIESHAAASTTLKLDREYTGANNTTVTYKIWTDKVALPVDCKETVRAWHDFSTSPMESVGVNEFRRISGQAPRAEGKPVYYATGDFIDPVQTSAIASLPSLSARKSAGVVKSLVFASSLPASLIASVSAGEPVRLRISGSDVAAYNGDITVSSISQTSVANDTLNYIVPIELLEDATADSALVVESLNQESESSRFREMYVFPAISQGRISIHVDYIKQAIELNSDSDEPAMPIEDRVVLLYGALARAWKRHRNPEESATNQAMYADKLAQMASKLQDTFEKPRLKPSRAYLSAKRSPAATRRVDASFPGGIGGGSAGAIVKGTPNSVTVFNGNGETEGSSISINELNALAGVTSNIQTQLDGKLGNADFTSLQADVATAQSDITALQGADVTLQTNIDNETTARTDADTTLQANIDAEATARTATDNALDTRVTAVEAYTTDDISEGSTNLYYTNTRADSRITAQKGVASGLASLGSDGKIPSSQVPAIAITDTYVAASQAAMLALSNAETGDICVRTDLSKSFILAGTSYSTLSDWQELLTPPGGVTSVNGNTGAVTLTTTDITEGTNLYYTDTRADARITPKFDTSTGHKHDGVDSKKILATNLDPTGASLGQVPKYNGSNIVWDYAGGSGGINLLTLDTSFQVSKATNSDAETSVGDWAAYADAAGTSPVDMTGGSPNTTIARDTTSPLNGLAHFTMTVSSGATRQGEGVSCVANVPPAYRGKTVSFQFPFQITGTVVDGDFTLYAYDVTNNPLVPIQLYQAGKILGSQGTAIGTFTIPGNCAQLRVGIHVARASNTGAVTIKFDDVKVTPDTPAIGMAGSDWKSDLTWIPSPGFGTTTNNNFWYRRVGDTMQIKGNFTGGTTAASVAYIQLPAGYTIDSTKFSSQTNLQKIGFGHEISSSSTAIASGTLSVLFYDGSATDRVFIANGAISTQLTKTNAVNILNSNEVYAFEFSIPIAGWSSNVTMGQSSTWTLSSILANGTRVTTTPSKLGEYRAMVKSASAFTATDTAPSAGWGPSASDGMRIDGSVNYATAGTSGQPNYWEVYIGPNKNVRFDFFGSTGFTTKANVTFSNYGTTNYIGTMSGYDKKTGLAYVETISQDSATTTRNAGYSYSGGTRSILSSVYWDATVSENALAVGIQAPRSEVVFMTGNGHGSTNTKIRNYSTVTSTGTAMLAATSATLGASVQILEDGVYALTAVDRRTTGSVYIGFSVDSTELTTNVLSINKANRLTMKASVSSDYDSVTVIRNFRNGQVLRCHQDGSADSTTDNVLWSVTKVSN